MVDTFRAKPASPAATIRVLYAEPSENEVDLLKRHLARHAPHVQLDAVGDAAQALARLPPDASVSPDVLLLDSRLPGIDALDMVREVCQTRRAGAAHHRHHGPG